MNAKGARPAEVLQLGDPSLRVVSSSVEDVEALGFRREVARLHATLAAFRRRHGFGRAVAAPQVGIPHRFIALRLDGRSFTAVNPEIVERSDETFTLWDDCMSFPDLLVRVRRHARVVVSFTDLERGAAEWTIEDRATAELLQHEIDHLDGVLAVDRAVDRDAVVTRAAFARHAERFRAQVDHAPGR